MRKIVLVVCTVFVFGAALLAQDKIETKWHCDKATTENKLDVGDVADHTYTILQGTCSAAPGGSFEEKSGAFTEFQEAWKTKMNNHGRFNVTMADGDKVFYTYAGSAALVKKTAMNKWTIGSGTGKYKGIKGSGSCSGTFNDDGSSDWQCSGTYTMGK